MNKILSLIFLSCLLVINTYGQKRSYNFQDIDLRKIRKEVNHGQRISLPTESTSFLVKPDKVMSAELKEIYPDIRSYDLIDDNGEKTGKMVLTPDHFYYTVFKGNTIETFYPNHTSGTYTFERGTDEKLLCSTEELKENLERTSRSDIGKYTYGEELKSFRLAIITTGEFYEQHGNDDNVVLGEVVKAVGTVNRIYERDMSVNFTLTGRVKLFSDKETDPFTPVLGTGASGRTIQSARAFNDEFNVDDYDIGITFNTNSDGWPGGGVAVIQSVCDLQVSSNGPTKARVWAASAGEVDNAFTYLVSHEIGHAFGARHTMNSDSELCADAISETSAFEIGSGNTIMAYGGRCEEGQDYVQEAETVNNYFHFWSLYVMSQYIETLGCQQVIPTVNTAPDLTINPCGVDAYQIPLNTPFTLIAAGSDPEGDNLTYVWEQFDEDGVGSPNAGFLGDAAANSSRGPLFRGYPPNANPARDFPRFYNFFFQDPFESLPNVPRDLTFRCTVRDNNAEGGIFVSDEITVEVLDMGPLMVEIDSLIDTIVGGESINLTWSDDGISSICDRVDVTLRSLNDPNIVIPVATNIPFSSQGLEYFIAPGFSIDGDFHFKVECTDYECFSFYNYSRPFFSSTNNCPPPELYFTCGLDDITSNIGEESLNFSEAQAFSGIQNYSTEITLNDDNERAQLIRMSLIQECETLFFPSGNPVRTNFEFTNFRVAESGTFRFSNLTSPFAGLIIYDEDLYNENDPCVSLIGTNLSESVNSPGSLTTTFREWVDIELESCKNYRLGVTKAEIEPRTFSISITGPSALSIDEGKTLDNSFLYVVENEDGIIETFLDQPDFRTLRQGQKRVYTIEVDPETFNPQDYVGKLLIDIGIDGICVGRSANATDLLLINPLPDEDQDGYHTDEDCDDSDPNVNPGQPEIRNNAIDENCDGIIEGDDEDQDGFTLGIDCDDTDPNINPEAEEILNNDVDEDCDGIANVIDEDMDGFNSDVDCNDQDASVNPEAEEIPNNDVDENCDGEVLVIDNDMDGFNSDQDCDDSNAAINPDADEVPNNDIDENCDGEVLVIDEDMDGFNSDVDCNDQDASINPNAEEIPENAIDEDCDGIVLNFDADMDGFNSEDDCDDSDPNVNPNAEEIANNDVDENCDGVLLMIDEDMDGYNSEEDCDDTDPAINPGAEEIPNNDIDENCDGAVILIDNDMDGYNSTEDCDDMDPTINPGAVEIPNNDVDEDCDGEAIFVDVDMDGFNSDEDCNDSDPAINPDATEIPNNDIDENCNGELGFTDDDMDGFNGSVDCNDQDSTVYPGAPEIIGNGIDEDCDGEDLTSSTLEEDENQIQIFPNPSNSEVTIDLGNEPGIIRVRNTNGQYLYSSNISSTRHNLKISYFPKGVYFVEIVLHNSEKSVVRKLVKI